MQRSDVYGSTDLDPAMATANRLHPGRVSQEAARHDIMHTTAQEPDLERSNSDLDSKSDEKVNTPFYDEKAPALGYGGAVNVEDVEDRQESFTPEDLARGEPFPESSLPHEDGDGLTLRALIVGTGLGGLIAASNVYLGLKTGFTFGASLFGSLLGFAIIKAMARSLPDRWGGGYFGPKENVTIQSAATGACGLSGLFVAAVPAMYRLELLGTSPKADFARLFTFCFATAFYGCFFAIPLRKFYILKQRLIFPTPTATALAIRAMHTATGAAIAKKKTKALGIAFGVSIAYCVLNQFVPGLLADQHWAYWLYSWGWTSILVVDSWGWYTTITPAFIGSGMLAGVNASVSFLVGLFLAYGLIGPSLVATGEAKCVQYGDPYPAHAFTCFSMNGYRPDVAGHDDVKDASPRYWVIWPAVLMMFVYSFAEVGMNGKSIGRAVKSGVMETYCKLTGKEMQIYEKELDDPAKPHQQVGMLWWMGGLVASTVMTIVVCTVQFNMNAGNVILAVILAFLFAFIGIQSSGTTDINPLSSVAKASQLIIGGVVKGQGVTGNSAMLQNLLGGSIASSAAYHSVDMVGDLKTGHWLRASPKTQFWAQLFGSVFAAPLSTGLYVLFTQAYPCINDGSDGCQFGAPSVAAWKAVATAVVAEKLPVSLSSGITAIVLSIVAALTVVAKYKWIPAKYHVYIPNWNAIGIGFLVPDTNYGIAMTFGALVAWAWAKKFPGNADIYCYAIAAGMVAGEGIAGVVNAILQIANVSQSLVASNVGLPPWLV